ncbi:hypothetical protein L195_g047184 [Trifolium pratense]|uniref:Uncharacterized protein n=1 Tax=Trifolium pratense TaxID=57577 RepID=A0A2K3MJY4_TRIPR|nr:hypothetical protein L195_g047184 [Trifolium pratense]
MGHHLKTSHAFPYSTQRNSIVSSSQRHHHHHIGSSLSGLPFESHFGFFPKSSETSLMNNFGYSGMSLEYNDGNYMLNAGVSGLLPTTMESLSDRVRSRRIDNNGSQDDSKKLFQLDLDKIKVVKI